MKRVISRLQLKHHLNRLYQAASRSVYFPPVVVLVAILFITFWSWLNARQNLQTNFNQAIDSKVQNLEETINRRFNVYASSLQSAAALLKANPNLTKNQWDAYFTSLATTNDVAGIQGAALAVTFQANDSRQVYDRMQRQGVTNFSIHPKPQAGALSSAVLYIYPPANNRSAIGFDMLSEPTRREAMLKARTTGRPTLTKKLTLVQDVKVDDGQGFLLYVPYFNGSPGNQAAREKQLAGYVYGGFRAKQLLSQITERISQDQHFSLSIYDTAVSEHSLLYKTANSSEVEKTTGVHKANKTISAYGSTWQLEFSFDKSQVMSRPEQSAPLYVLLVGSSAALFVFLALLYIFKSRARELQLQKDHEVNLAKDELLSLASHQMRTPATGVKQYLGMVLQGFAGKLDKTQQELLTKAYTSNERQLHVINQVLHLAKLEAGRIVLARQPTNLSSLIQDIVAEQTDELKACGHNLKLKLPKQPIILKVDGHMMRMAIENLLTNAIKYTLTAGTIQVRLAQAANQVTITVKDSGIGIDPSQFDEIFKQFTRLYDEQSAQVSGTGVGLYLADQLVRLHGGKLTVKSVPSKGSEFTIYLPKKGRLKKK